METIHEFALDDPRARMMWNGQAFRAIRIEQSATTGKLSVWCCQQTRRGADRKYNGWIWLTLENSLEKFPDAGGIELAAYVREIAAK